MSNFTDLSRNLTTSSKYATFPIDPRTFGFDIVIEDGSHWTVHSWFRGEKHLLEALFPTYFSD